MNLQFWDKNNYTYHVLKIPTDEGRKLTLYYRAYTTSEHIREMFEEKKNLYQIFNSQEETAKPKESKELGGIRLKTFENPMLKTTEEKPKKTQDDILSDIPKDRTLFLMNFDKQFDEQELRKWFRTIGKIRYVFKGQYSKKSKETNSKKKMFYALIIYKNQREMKIAIDNPEYLQDRIIDMYKHLNIRVDEFKKEKYRETLINTFGKEELTQEKSDFQKKMEDGGFTLVTDHTGGITKFEEKYLKGKPILENEEKPKKKKKKELDNFYRFQVKNSQFMEETGLGSKAHKNSYNLIADEKKKLQQSFQQDIEKLKALMSQKKGDASS